MQTLLFEQDDSLFFASGKMLFVEKIKEPVQRWAAEGCDDAATWRVEEKGAKKKRRKRCTAGKLRTVPENSLENCALCRKTCRKTA